MTTFGLGWAVVGLLGLGLAPAGLVTALLVAIALTVVVVIGNGNAIAELPADAGGDRDVSPSAGRVYQLVNLAQGVAIMLLVVGLVRAEHTELIAPAVCAVVGLHFLPLARVFDLGTYRLTGVLLIGIAAVALSASLGAGLGAQLVLSMVGLPAALVLWGTASSVARQG